MLGQTLVTKQTGGGQARQRALVAEKMKLVNEMYFAILLDRASAGPMVIACSEGGTSIEDLAEAHPEKIIKMKIDLESGLTSSRRSSSPRTQGVRIRKTRNSFRRSTRCLSPATARCWR